MKKKCPICKETREDDGQKIRIPLELNRDDYVVYQLKMLIYNYDQEKKGGTMESYLDDGLLEEIVDFMQQEIDREKRELAERIEDITIKYYKDKWEIIDFDCEDALHKAIQKELI